MPTALVHRLSARAPDDVAPIEAAIGSGAIDPAGIVAILGKTEGNGCVNDFTRAFAVRALRDAIAVHTPTDRVALVMSGGSEGGLAPHWLVLERRDGVAGPTPALAIGTAHTPALPPEHLGRRAQAALVADGVRAAMAEARGTATATPDTLKSMGLSRGASALGVALALGEIAADEVADTAIGRDFSLWSGRASTSAGVELLNHEIVVLGMSRGWNGRLAIDHAVMTDGIDVEPVRRALGRLGVATVGQLGAAERGRVVAVLAKAEAGSTGQLRGYRHTMLDDSDISATRHARAFVGGALAALIGHAEIFVSGGAEHQGPDGGGPVAVIVSREEAR